MNADKLNLEGKDTSIEHKLVSLRLFATDFERRVTGYKQTQSGLSWEYTGQVLCGSSTASRLTGFLQAYANESNLISEVGDFEKAWQKYRSIKTMLDSLLLDIYCEEDMKAVIQLFYDALTKIMDIICASKPMFKTIFQRAFEEDMKVKGLTI